VDGSSVIDGNTTLGDSQADTVTVNAGPVNLPGATSAADALTIGGTANLYRPSANTLRTDDTLEVGGDLDVEGVGQLGIAGLALPETTTPATPAEGGVLFVRCEAASGGTLFLGVIWPTGVTDNIATESFAGCTP
jgi:hypothetical protein